MTSRWPAAIASAAGTRWALAGPGLAIAVCAAAMLANRGPQKRTPASGSMVPLEVAR
jgi:hypothetical protein